uniref:Uncharacterized protein LOC105034787 n=1 Tax=Elaeis guineensis var. tenera TaxID=51953 RepID=A0A6I9QF28_ELAGV|nr:uncharacterized protein LOC105034787 [Elaeis guineensis]
MGLTQEAIRVHCDSQSALLLAQNSVYHAKTKHIDIRYHQIRELMEDGEVELIKVHTKENPADALTKGIFDGWKNSNHAFKGMLLDEGLKETKEDCMEQQKQMVSTFVKEGHYVATIITKLNDVEKELAEAREKERLAKARAAAMEVDAVRSKNKLKKIEATLALEKKERLEAQAMIIDMEQKAQE